MPSLLTRCTLDITQIQMFISMLPMIIIRAPLTGILAVINLSKQNYIWTGVIASIVLIIIIFVIFLITSLTPRMKIVNKLTDKLNQVSFEHISGIRVIHAYNAYDYQAKRFNDVNAPLTDTNIYVNSRMSAMYPVLTFFQSIPGIIIYVTGAYMIMSLADSSAKLALFSDMLVAFFYSGIVINAFMIITLMLIQLPRLLVCSGRVNEVINSPVSIQDGNYSGEIAKSGTIEFNHVSFKYPGAGANSLDDISFSVSRGQTVAFIGPTGCGKSSLLNLIPRLYDASEGRILVDGVDVKDFNLADLRSRIGYVPQKNILFTGTIADNINFSGNNNNLERASEIAQAKDFIEARPDSYNSQVEHGGGNFSGGQRQRLTIARAVSKSAEIYLFDDSFSALDLVTDKKLRQALREEFQDATILIAAQRISTIINADKIIVIDKGRIVGEGTHSELMQSCPLYQEIAKSQTGQD